MRNWRRDGAIFHLNRVCAGSSRGHMEARLAVQEMGLPTFMYEASTGDRADYNEPEVFRHIDAFMETLGLTRPD